VLVPSLFIRAREPHPGFLNARKYPSSAEKLSLGDPKEPPLLRESASRDHQRSEKFYRLFSTRARLSRARLVSMKHRPYCFDLARFFHSVCLTQRGLRKIIVRRFNGNDQRCCFTWLKDIFISALLVDRLLVIN